MRFFEPDAGGRRFAGKKKYLVLVSSSLVSLAVSLCLLEGLLDVAGRVYVRSRQAEPLHSRSSGRIIKDSISVLCLGDSFTFGGRGTGSKSYPSVLGKLLEQKHPGLVQVTNHGVCEMTSKDLLANLPSVVTFSRPDLAVILIGAANLWDPYPFADELMSTSERLDSFIRRRHVYKLLRHIWFELIVGTTRTVSDPAIPKMEPNGGSLAVPVFERIFQMLKAHPEKEVRHAHLAAMASTPDLTGMIAGGMLQLLDGNDGAALASFRRLKKGLRAAGDEHGVEAIFAQGRDCILELDPRPNGQKSERINLFLLGLGPPESVRHIVEPLVLFYSYNSAFDPLRAVHAIDDAIADDPVLYGNRRLEAARLTLSDLDGWRGKVGVWYEENLTTIVSRLQYEGIQVVLQTYPISYEPINTLARKVAKQTGVSLVDQQELFKPLLAKDYGKYIRDDTHCTDAGHEVMARNVFESLEKHYLSDPRWVKDLTDHCSDNTHKADLPSAMLNRPVRQ